MAGLLAHATVGDTLGVASARTTTVPTTASTEIVAQQGQPPPVRPGRGEGQGERPQLTDDQRQEMQHQREAAEQQYIDSLAKNLGVSSDTLKSALEQTRKDMQAQRVTEIQQPVADGKLTQERGRPDDPADAGRPRRAGRHARPRL